MADAQSGKQYVDSKTAEILKANSRSSVKQSDGITPISSKLNHGLFLTDIAQSHHFTVSIEGFDMSNFTVPSGTYKDFLPVKNIQLNYTSYESMTIPVSIFGDFPLLNRKRVSTVTLSCYDTDDNKLEHEILKWEDECFPKGRYAAYMEDIARKFTYKGYDVKGKETFNISFYVIPSGNVNVSRDYSANESKIINFSLVCVGDGTTSATGDSKLNRTASKAMKLQK